MNWLIFFSVITLMTGIFGFTGIPVSAGAVVEILLILLLIVVGGFLVKQLTYRTNDPV